MSKWQISPRMFKKLEHVREMLVRGLFNGYLTSEFVEVCLVDLAGGAYEIMHTRLNEQVTLAIAMTLRNQDMVGEHTDTARKPRCCRPSSKGAMTENSLDTLPMREKVTKWQYDKRAKFWDREPERRSWKLYRYTQYRPIDA